MFGVILPGRPCLTSLTTISQTQFALSFPSTPSFSHIVVFILPGNVLPPDTAAAVYLQLPYQIQFKFLGAIGNEKQSAIFKVNTHGIERVEPATGDAMTDAGISGIEQLLPGLVSLGISVEPVTNIQEQLVTLQAESSNPTALIRRPPSTEILAQRIIKNAFNFLASFAGGPGGREVVPLKSFQDWWTKFERKIHNDPGFLERDEDG